MCSFSIAFWGCLVLFYFYLRFIKNFQIIWEEFPFFSQFFTIHLNCCGGLAIVRNPGGRHTQALVGYATLFALPSLCVPAARVPHAMALFTFLSLCPRLLPRARSVHVCYSFTLPLGCCRGIALCVFVILLRFPLGCCRGIAWIFLLFARVCSGLAQHHIECHHEAEAHHKCYGGAV